MKEMKNSTEDNPQYFTKKIKVNFTCDLNDIQFIDFTFKTNGDPYKTKCIINHVSKGDIIVDHSFNDINKIILNKNRTNHVEIRGFRR